MTFENIALQALQDHRVLSIGRNYKPTFTGPFFRVQWHLLSYRPIKLEQQLTFKDSVILTKDLRRERTRDQMVIDTEENTDKFKVKDTKRQ